METEDDNSYYNVINRYEEIGARINPTFNDFSNNKEINIPETFKDVILKICPEIVDVNTKLTDFNKAIDSWIKATGTDTTTNPSLPKTVVDNDKLANFNKAIDSWITATGTN